MGCYEPIIVSEQFHAWVGTFHERYGGTYKEVLNGEVLAGDAAYGEAYGIWLALMEMSKSSGVQHGEDQGVGAASL